MGEIIVRNIGKRTWKATPSKSWVSKLDIIQFLRCKYRVFIAHKLNKPFVEFVDSEMIKAIIEQGTKFEASIISQMPFQEVDSIESVIEERAILRSAELIQNNKLGIRGIVDLIDVEEGKLYPIEIKSHKNVEESDRLELAFYWELLHPLRKGSPKPKGFVLLNTGEIVKVILNEEDFAKLKNIIKEVRLVKEIGCQPIICQECKICTLKGECLSEVYRKGGLSLIHGIGEVRQEQLYNLGIKNIHDLAKADATKFLPSMGGIKGMITHAKSWIKLRPIYFGEHPPPVSSELIILDLEYDQFVLIWLVGLLVVDTKGMECYQFFAEEKSKEREILINLTNLLSRYNSHQILTWKGANADIPQLETAWRRCKLPTSKLADLEDRHLDLYQLTLNSCRFPLKSFGLKEVGKYLGFTRKHEDINGLLAPHLYNQYLRMPKMSKEKRLLKTKLLEYNREDLEATLFILNELKSLSEAKNK